MNGTPDLDSFITAAQQFRALAEIEGPAGEPDLGTIRNLLLRLIFHIPAVDAAPHGVEFDGTKPDATACLKFTARFRAFPFNFYRVVFDPHDLEATDEPVMGMLSDDLADIYCDLAEGLSNYEQGHIPEACFDWSNSYRTHWARHAVNALSAIEIYRTAYYSASNAP